MSSEPNMPGGPAQHLGAASREPELGNGDDEDPVEADKVIEFNYH